MKKKYLKPQVEEQIMDMTEMMATSIDLSEDTVNPSDAEGRNVDDLFDFEDSDIPE